MNYIKKLEADVEALRTENGAMKEFLIRFRLHLLSEKFHHDTTIQVADVDRWITEILSV